MQQKKSTYTLEEAKRSMERYCVYQDRCHQEIEKKLRQMNMIPQACDLILLHLMEHDFLNEERFSRSFARGKFRIKQWGRRRIEMELKQRDISAYNIKAGLSEISQEEYEKVFEEVSKKRFDSVREPNVFKKRKKVADFLLRKGFESNKVYEVLRELEKENNS
ncbi:regulatory protein RecX [Lutimonas halocynthiae]|uniref:regulatory protein RecX n=1 Tax=Lutimonas halocynthiae TaxID=1446477 RepID=UPI0025B35FA8|nr:regulatory protein RecX [Lutimonas halocynthiae]MDN3641890.1 regulatory protein RecX [Lutimonas halocynthiae]